MINNTEKKKKLRDLPGIDILMKDERIAALIEECGQELVTYAARNVIDIARQKILNDEEVFDKNQIIETIISTCNLIGKPSLKPVINATGIIIHTNLGRAPLGKIVLEDIQDIILDYSNLEFDLDAAFRGKRDTHLKGLLKFVTGAEYAVVVNNNAAAIILVRMVTPRVY